MTPDYGIEPELTAVFRNVGLHKLHIFEACFGRALSRGGEGNGVKIQTSNLTGRTYYLQQQQRDIAHAAAEVQNPHAGRDACCREKALGVRLQHLGLNRQATAFPVGMTHYVRLRRTRHV